MIQFVGLHLGTETASAAILARDLSLSARSETRMLHVTRDPSKDVLEVPTAEWVRAGSYAIQEAYFQLPASRRKPWGLGLSGPAGWIALDFDYEPISPLRITRDVPVGEDLASWLEPRPKLRGHISVVLSPKDYFRFAVSKGLAADVTEASRMRMLQAGRSEWSTSRVEEEGWAVEWLPPVFDSHVPTGRISEEGIRKTSLPGGSWLVAGAHETEAALVSGGDLRGKDLWILSRPGSARAVCAYGIPGLQPDGLPEAWSVVRSPVAGKGILERALDEAGGDGREVAAAERARAELRETGLDVQEVRRCQPSPEVGAALLAAVGSGLARGWDAYYAALAPPPAGA